MVGPEGLAYLNRFNEVEMSNHCEIANAERGVAVSLSNRKSMTWRFADVLNIICEVMPQLRRETVESRIKQWQRGGFPAAVRVGRGVKCAYTDEMLWQMIFVAELCNFGMPFAEAKRLVERRKLHPLPDYAVRFGVRFGISQTVDRRSGIMIDVPALAKIVDNHRARREVVA